MWVANSDSALYRPLFLTGILTVLHMKRYSVGTCELHVSLSVPLLVKTLRARNPRGPWLLNRGKSTWNGSCLCLCFVLVRNCRHALAHDPREAAIRGGRVDRVVISCTPYKVHESVIACSCAICV